VLDHFAGSASTLIACERTARPCAALEVEPVDCDVIVVQVATVEKPQAAQETAAKAAMAQGSSTGPANARAGGPDRC
jgi:hypothetical protein